MIYPLVSIGIPTYNQEQYLEKAILSALNQTYSPIEVIVVEDCYIKNTTEKISFLKKKFPSVIFIVNTKRLGRVENYKSILNIHSNGKFYLNLDGDDYFTNNDFIKNAMTAINVEGYENVLFYQGTHIYKTIKSENTIIPNIKENTVVFQSKEYIKDFFLINHFSHMSTLFNKYHAIQVGFYDKDIISADIYSLLKLCIKFPNKKVIISKEISGVWLQHSENASKSLSFSLHKKNYALYIELFIQQLRSPFFSTKDGYLWFSKSFFTYWRSWLSIKIKRTKY